MTAKAPNRTDTRFPAGRPDHSEIRRAAV